MYDLISNTNGTLYNSLLQAVVISPIAGLLWAALWASAVRTKRPQVEKDLLSVEIENLYVYGSSVELNANQKVGDDQNSNMILAPCCIVILGIFFGYMIDSRLPTYTMSVAAEILVGITVGNIAIGIFQHHGRDWSWFRHVVILLIGCVAIIGLSKIADENREYWFMIRGTPLVGAIITTLQTGDIPWLLGQITAQIVLAFLLFIICFGVIHMSTQIFLARIRPGSIILLPLVRFSRRFNGLWYIFVVLLAIFISAAALFGYVSQLLVHFS